MSIPLGEQVRLESRYRVRRQTTKAARRPARQERTVKAKGDDEFTKRMPDTGGDFIDGNDVEGHKRNARDADGIARRDNAESFRLNVAPDEQDVEGHRFLSATGDGAEELYRGGPSTQGEILKRGPGDNPHGD